MLIFSLIFVVFILIEGYFLYKIVSASNNLSEIEVEKYSKVLVLGANVYSNTFKDRIRTLYTIQNLNPNIKVMFSGTKFEARLFLKWYQKDVIFVDSQAKNTKDNIANSVKKITSNTLIVTNCFHRYRVGLILQDNHLKAKVVSMDQKVYYQSIIREMLAIHKHFFNNIFKFS